MKTGSSATDTFELKGHKMRQPPHFRERREAAAAIKFRIASKQFG